MSGSDFSAPSASDFSAPSGSLVWYPSLSVTVYFFDDELKYFAFQQFPITKNTKYGQILNQCRAQYLERLHLESPPVESPPPGKQLDLWLCSFVFEGGMTTFKVHTHLDNPLMGLIPVDPKHRDFRYFLAQSPRHVCVVPKFKITVKIPPSLSPHSSKFVVVCDPFTSYYDLKLKLEDKFGKDIISQETLTVVNATIGKTFNWELSNKKISGIDYLDAHRVTIIKYATHEYYLHVWSDRNQNNYFYRTRPYFTLPIFRLRYQVPKMHRYNVDSKGRWNTMPLYDLTGEYIGPKVKADDDPDGTHWDKLVREYTKAHYEDDDGVEVSKTNGGAKPPDGGNILNRRNSKRRNSKRRNSKRRNSKRRNSKRRNSKRRKLTRRPN
jgi:hypothetical protein